MIIIFKIICGFIGLKLAIWMKASPFSGLIVGAIIGHSLDIVASTKIQTARAKKYWRARANEQYHQVFIGSVFSMLGKLCAADGNLNAKENEAVEKVINEMLKLRRRDRNEALKIFRAAYRQPNSFQYDAAQYYEVHRDDQTSLENFLSVLFSVAVADGKLTANEEQLLRSAASVFNVSDTRYEELRTMFTGQRSARANGEQLLSNGNDPYSVLGCKPSDPVPVIKQSYRKLVSDYHPDKIVGKNLPEDFTKFANEKFKAIQSAYEAVKSEKGFS